MIFAYSVFAIRFNIRVANRCIDANQWGTSHETLAELDYTENCTVPLLRVTDDGIP
jgi:hypothetical protein